MRAFLLRLRQSLLTGVSFSIPFIACGGILIAASIACVPMTAAGPDFTRAPLAKLVLDIGSASFALMLPVLAGYIAYALAGKPGLVPGFVGGYLAGHLDGTAQMSAGFLGALLAGLLAGYAVNFMKAMPMPKILRPVMPILIIPAVTSLFIGVVILKAVGLPIAGLMKVSGTWLASMSGSNSVLLAAILGAMIAFDMGGPINKTAFFFGAAMLKEGNPLIMGACAAAICTPPLGLGLATVLHKELWTAEQRESGTASLAMGLIGITEGAIPFAAADPFRVIPCIMAGSMVASIIAILSGVADHAPHGGPIVLAVVDHRAMYIVAISVGMAVTAVAINLVKSLTSPRANSNPPVSLAS